MFSNDLSETSNYAMYARSADFRIKLFPIKILISIF